MTEVAATVIRILTPEGTLVVEVDDPGVQVTVEGDGGLTITGAGPQQLRVRPGQYRVRASKDDKSVPVSQELVTVSRGGKQVVRVSHERQEVASQPLTREEKLEQALRQAEEGDKFAKMGEPLRGPNPEQAELYYRKAVAIFEKLVEASPESITYRNKLRGSQWGLASALNVQSASLIGRSEVSVAEAEQAVLLSKEAAALAPHDVGFWISLGLAHYRAHQWSAARDALLKTFEIRAPGASVLHDVQCSFALAAACWQLGDKEEAVRRYQFAVELMEKHRRTDAILRTARAETEKLLGPAGMASVAEAELARLSSILERNTADLKALLGRASTFRQLHRPDEALADFSKVIELAPNQAQFRSAYMGRAEIRLLRQDWQGALDDYEVLARLNPPGSYPIPQGMIASIHLFAPPPYGDVQKALPVLEQLKIRNAGYRTSLGIAYYRLGRIDDAVAAVEHAASMSSSPGSYTQFALALVYARTGQMEKARACYQKGEQLWSRRRSTLSEAMAKRHS